MHKILFLEDELQLARVVSETLRLKNFDVVHLPNGKLGLEAVLKQEFELCIVDVMMPFMDGFTFARELRKINVDIPILFLTARSQDKDVVEGFEAGGNDYLKKPFSLEELFLRCNELLKRTITKKTQAPVPIGDYIFYPIRQELWFKEMLTTKLSNRECELLLMLSDHRNELLHRNHVLVKLWGVDDAFSARTMDVFITKLRKYLKNDASIQILNLRGQGYKLLV
jgi:DNA-binding response OmpR family regulator